MRNIKRFGFIFYSLSTTVKPHYLSGSSSTLSPLLLDGSRGRCQGCLRCTSSFRRLPFQPKGSSNLGGEEGALQIALNQSQRQTQWFTEVNPEGKVHVVKFDDKWVADFDVIVGIIEKVRHGVSAPSCTKRGFCLAHFPSLSRQPNRPSTAKMVKKTERKVNVSGKPKHSLDANRSDAKAKNKDARTGATVHRLKMYNTRPKA